MMAQRTGENLELAVHVEADDQPELNSFAIGIRRDQPAVTAGLTCPSRRQPSTFKAIKRQMYGQQSSISYFLSSSANTNESHTR
jgi:hypothetical protein